MVKSIKGKPLITKSYFDEQFSKLGNLTKICTMFIVAAIVCLIMVVMVSTAHGQTVPNAPPTVTVDEISCWEDWRFIDDWTTTRSASWPVAFKWKANDLDVEVRTKIGNHWLTVERVPIAAQGVDVSKWAGNLRFYLVDRVRGSEMKLKVNPGTIAQCDIMPPPDGSAWVWKDGEGFVLAIVDVIEWVD